MDWMTAHVSVAPGDAVVARQGAAVVVADPSGPSQELFLDRLLAICEAGTQSVAAGMGRDLFRSVGRLVLDAETDGVPPFALVTGSEAGLLALLCGPMTILVSREGGDDEVLDGSRSSTYLDTVVTGDVAGVVLGPRAAEVVPDPRSSLTGGVVRGGGARLVPATGTPRDPVEHETLVNLNPAAEHPAMAELQLAAPDHVSQGPPAHDGGPAEVATEFTPISLAGHDGPSGDGLFSRPDDTSAEESAAATDAEVDVQGIVCSRGHFNAPSSRFCARCGISMVHQTHNLVTGPRPPLGVLVLDDGSVHALSTDYVLGRDPEASDDVQRGSALALAVDDPALAVSRVHARVILDGWEVRVVDAGSANGTFVAAEPDAEWQRLESEVPTTIAPGTRIRMGSRELSFESHQHE